MSAEIPPPIDNSVSHEQFVYSLAVFQDDLSLVHPQPGATPRQITDIPLDPFSPEGHRQYSLTSKAEMLNADRLLKTKYIVVGCMDWRVNKAIFDKAKAEGYQDDEILVITVGGGIVQQGEERIVAMKNALLYLDQHCQNLEKLLVSGHIERCGAVAYWTQGQIMDDEVYTMTQLIVIGSEEIVPDTLKDKTTTYLLKPTVSEEERLVDVEFFQIDS